MDRKWWAAIVPGIVAFVVAAFVLGLVVVKLSWAWIVPELFPGAVAQGLVAESISWPTAFKLAVIFGVVAAAGGVFSAPRQRT
jgi:hypothetical protein